MCRMNGMLCNLACCSPSSIKVILARELLRFKRNPVNSRLKTKLKENVESGKKSVNEDGCKRLKDLSALMIESFIEAQQAQLAL